MCSISFFGLIALLVLGMGFVMPVPPVDAQTSESLIPAVPVSAYVLPAVDTLRFPTYSAVMQTNLPRADRADIARRLLRREAVSLRAINPARQVGESDNFVVVNTASNEVKRISATLVDAGQSVYLWVEDGFSLDKQQARRFVDNFDQLVYQQTRQLWGTEALPGIDGDQRIYALFTAQTNPSVAGYYTSQHSYPASIVPNSNEHEMIIFNLMEFQNIMDSARATSVSAHEFQHMIRHNIDGNEATWVDEGFSMFTERHLGFDDNKWAVDEFMSAPSASLNHWDNPSLRGASYGAALMFMSYFYERFGLEGIQRLSQESADGLEGVDKVVRALGESGGADKFFADWVLANALQRPDLGFGYARAWQDLKPVSMTASTASYPFSVTGETAQYGTNYYELSGLMGVTSLKIDLEKTTEVALIPTQPPQGARFWYSNRGDESNPSLQREFDLTGVSSARLVFRTWFDLESMWDYVYLTASADGGQTWDMLQSRAMTLDNPHDRNYGVGITGSSEIFGGWLGDMVDLTPYAGKRVVVRLEMITDDAVTQAGFALDDVMIPEIQYSADFEQDDGGWQSNGWILTDNRLPQRTWLQAIEYQADGSVKLSRWMAEESGHFLLALSGTTERVVLAVSPFAPMTSVSMNYQLSVTTQ